MASRRRSNTLHVPGFGTITSSPPTTQRLATPDEVAAYRNWHAQHSTATDADFERATAARRGDREAQQTIATWIDRRKARGLWWGEDRDDD